MLADVRWYPDGRSGVDEFVRAHIPGAVFVDLDAVLAAPPSAAAGRHPLPDPAAFAAELGRLGIGDDDGVIAYDDAGGVIAARLVWMLRVLGHDAALLDGGLAAWPGPLARGTEAQRPPARFTPRPWPRDRLASADELGDADTVKLDARDRPRFRGEIEPLDPRAGHIPEARSLPCRDNLGDDGRLLPDATLRERLDALGIEPDTPIVSYCGSGVTACHNLLVLERLGYGHSRLYPGSWSQWSSDPTRPIATGE
ncbi:MAG TPA: sulfurtransferase [Solirubrobacteraceae bacterium]|nr:sulfurtransferase [Solirubrobacteraceae bacterium]